MSELLADVQSGGLAGIAGGAPAVVFLLVATVGLLLYPAMILHKYVRIMINILDERAEVEENGNGRNGLSLAHERVCFRASDGHRLEGVILSARGRSPAAVPCDGGTKGGGVPDGNGHCPVGVPVTYRGTVVFAHEFGSVWTSCMRYCRPLLRAGYDVFAFDFRGHGSSPPESGYKPRQWPSDREQADMEGAVRFLASHLERRGLPRAIALFGVSRGAGAAILGSVGCADVRAIVTDGAFSSDTTLEYLMRRFATVFARIRVVAENHPPVFWRFLRWLLFRECRRRFNCRFPSVRKAVARLGRRPLLFIHGEKDSYIPVAQSQILYERAVGPKLLWLVPDARHNCAVTVCPEEYAGRVLGFLDEHFALAPLPGEGVVERAAWSVTALSPTLSTTTQPGRRVDSLASPVPTA